MLKKSLIAVLSLAITVCFAGMVFAQASTPATPSKPKTETVKAATAEKVPAHKKVAPTRCIGAVVSVDATANTLVVKDKKGEQTFQVDPAAKIMIDKKESKLANVTKDMKIAVSYKMMDGKKVATAIMNNVEKV